RTPIPKSSSYRKTCKRCNIASRSWRNASTSPSACWPSSATPTVWARDESAGVGGDAGCGSLRPRDSIARDATGRDGAALLRPQLTSELRRIGAPAFAMTFGALPLAVCVSAGVSPIAMQLLDANGELQRLRRSVVAFEQRTFRTPLEGLPDFVDCLLTSDPPL